MDTSKYITIEDMLYLAAILVVIGFAYLIFSSKKVPWEQQDKAARQVAPTGSSWLLRLFESEGQPSIRLVLAAVVTLFSLCMLAASRLSDNQLETLLTFVGSLLLIGSARIAATAFANRPAAPATQIKADTAPVTADNVTLSSNAHATTSA
jgi:hypothetical protein